ncbi:hypothetical protein F0P96_18150 [Hymenobacter busanensis]|uniref:Uncharacterized protein n=1 Tax=Hymenobacter busanensis TaxID=2607656 RepID=A0A7L4ZST3_9BACT|nr:hypothetical protein [Hymenobacter busanensis]KAA9327159.1 hypothetical protein F0P96_18150 [Hymenobacter busanensis]QHJ05825.1 hypothetical protein GUY19_00350 [Hymenobacter busanensis]
MFQRLSGNLLLLLLASLLFTCDSNKTKDPIAPAQPAGSELLEGNIVLPTGTKYTTGALTVVSPIAEGTVTGTRYKLSTIKDEYTTVAAADAAGEPVLLGFRHPGQNTLDLSTQSTVLALLMNSAAAYSLSPAGKQLAIAEIQADPGFAAATQEVERLLRSNKSLLDTTNSVLQGYVSSVFTSVSQRLNGLPSRPVSIFRSGREITFANAGVPFTNIVGVYKDGQQVTQLNVEGQNFFASSLGGALEAAINGPSPSTASYTMVGDGKFDIRIRTGKPGSGANGPEQLNALGHNLAQGAILIVSGILPQFKGRKECAQKLATTAINQANNFKNITSITTATEASLVIGKITYGIIKDATALLKSCQGADEQAIIKFSEYTSKLIKFLDVTTKRIGNSMNLGVLTIGWMAYPAAQDTCFLATANSVGPCASLRLELVSGNGQTAVKSTALPNPVRVRVLNDAGQPRSGVSVNFTPASGSGSASPSATTTDANGYAQATWTLGATAGPQSLVATSLDAGGQPLPGSPIQFAATATTPTLPPVPITFTWQMMATACGNAPQAAQTMSMTLASPTGGGGSHPYGFAGCGNETFTLNLPPGTYSGTFSWTSARRADNYRSIGVRCNGGCRGYYIAWDFSPASTPSTAFGYNSSSQSPNISIWQTSDATSDSGSAPFTLRVD